MRTGRVRATWSGIGIAVLAAVPVVMDGKVVGAIGVSGGKSSENAQVADAAVNALAKQV